MTSTTIGRQRFDMGRVVERTFGAVGANAVPLLLVSLLLVGVPQVIWSFVQTGMLADYGAGIGGGFGAIGVGLAGWVISLACNTLMQGAVTHAVVADLQGRKATLGDSLGAALGSFWVLLALGLLSAIGIGFGFILLIVPGIFLFLLWFVVGPVAVAEKVGVGRAFDRSQKLTENHRWVILLLAVVYGIVAWILMVVLGMVGVAALAVSGGLGGPLALVLTGLIQAVFAMVSAAGVAAVYVELRTIKEGGGHNNVAAIFD